MARKGDANKAIAALNGTKVGGLALNINEARPKPERAGGAVGLQWRIPLASRATLVI